MNNPTRGKRAIIIGGSMAGLLTARILSERFEEVTIYDRDTLPDSNDTRKGVPQGLHSHVLLKGGEEVISRLFPNFYQELNDSGEVPFIDSHQVRYFHYGVWRMNISTGLKKTLISRTFLEWQVRLRVTRIPNVTLHMQTSVQHLLTDEAKNRVTGVRITTADGETEDQFADLVVECGGRGSQLPQWLEAIGYERPEQQEVKINIGYSTRIYKMEHDPYDWGYMLIYPKAPHGTKIGVMQRREYGEWIVTLAGCVGDYPPQDEDEFLKWAAKLDQPHMYEAIRNATPVTPIKISRLPSSLRRRYEKLKRFPEGLLLVGDSACSNNPVYGQGMSITALGVQAMEQHLNELEQTGAATLQANRYFKKLASIIDLAWIPAITEDFRYRQVVGKKPFGTKLLNWYMGHLFELTAVDPQIYFQITVVMNLVASPKTLFTRKIIGKVLKKILTGSRSVRAARLQAEANVSAGAGVNA